MSGFPKLTGFLLIAAILSSPAEDYVIKSGSIAGPHLAVIEVEGTLPETLIKSWKIVPPLKIQRIKRNNNRMYISTPEPFQLDRHYYLTGIRPDSLFLRPDGILDSLYSDKPLGYNISDREINFRVFAPRAKWVKLVIYHKYDDNTGQEYHMRKDRSGVWEYRAPESWTGSFYGYRLWGPQGEGEMFDSTVVVADPYSPAVVTKNHFRHPARTLIMPPVDFTWQDDRWHTPDWKDLIIYEMHIRDLTRHPSSGVERTYRGTYPGFLHTPQRGGLPYVKKLGVNAVELLPSQDFANMEVPYKDQNAPVYNTWNPYARNHWGYMTSYFFAPESYYASNGNMTGGNYNGEEGIQVVEFKQMVNHLHRNGIAVLMDVVYNHVSQYDYNPLKYIDKFYYFRLNEDCSFTSVSGCGNDLKTERPMARRLILDSILHWMRDYHIDGFRFDLATMIDWHTINRIREEAQKVNPRVILIAEPWIPGYDPEGFSRRGWAAWNDQIRNGVKGQNPHDGLGFIFGKWQGNNTKKALERYIMGSLQLHGGQFINQSHSVNYLESHDDYTLGDFIRIGLDDVRADEKIEIMKSHVQLNTRQLKLNKLAALFLFTSQGPLMIHEGQEYARSKVIAPTNAPDPDVGELDHNSYNKDNETNWLNFDHAELNTDLWNYYRGLIRLRKAHAAIRHAEPAQYTFFDQTDSLFMVYRLHHDQSDYIVIFNGNPAEKRTFELPAGHWDVLADHSKASEIPIRKVKGKLETAASSGMVLVRESISK